MIVPPRRGPRGRLVALATGALLLLTVPATLATDTRRTGPADPDLLAPGMAQEDANPAELRAQLDELASRYDDLLIDNVKLQATLDDLTGERDQLARTLDHFDDIYGPMEADRQLLLELRKETPETRPEAEAQVERIRSLALSADPAHLGQLVDRLGEAAPAWFEWRFDDHTSANDAAQAYVESGAGAFDTTMNQFRSEVLLSVADRLDGILTIIDRVR
jgi:hypothetical protein